MNPEEHSTDNLLGLDEYDRFGIVIFQVSWQDL